MTVGRKKKVYAGCIQETWRTGKESWENGGFVLFHNGLAQKPCSRGAQGVAIVLGPEVRQAWKKAGSQQIFIGHRIVAARLQTLDPKGRPLTIVLASTYAPDSSRAIGEHEEFEVDRQRLYDSVKRHEILVEGTDANASIGIRGKHDLKDAEQDRVLGLYGIPHVNSAGRSLHQLSRIKPALRPDNFLQKDCSWESPVGLHNLEPSCTKVAISARSIYHEAARP